MTRQEAARLGKEEGQTVAERVCLEPPFDLLPPILEKWSKRKTWYESLDKNKERLVSKHGLNSLPLESAFERGYITAGEQWVRRYIKELKDDGLLKETR